MLGQRPQLAAAEAGAAERLQAVPVGPLDGPQDVRAVARAADGDEQVARAGQVLELLDEDAVEALVVAPGEDVRRVVGQAEDAQAASCVSLSKSSRRSVPLPRSSQKCEAFEPLPPLPMTKTKRPCS